MQRPAAPRGGTAAGMQRPRSERKGVQAGQGDKTEVLRQPHSDVRTAVSVELLCERMRVLPVSRQKQDHIAQETEPRRYKARGHSLAGHGAQTSGHRGRRRPAAQPAGVYTRIYRHHIWHTPQKRSHKAGEREHSRHNGGQLPPPARCRHRHVHTVSGDLPQGQLRTAAPQRTEKRLRLAHRSYGQSHAGRHRRCGHRRAVRTEHIQV